MFRITGLTSVSIIVICALNTACNQTPRPTHETTPIVGEIDLLKNKNGILKGDPVIDGSVVETQTVGINDAGKNIICTGVIVAPKLILTAAHCATGKVSDLTVFFGAKMDNMAFPISVASIFYSSKFNKLFIKNRQDLAILLLEHPVPLGYKPAELYNVTGAIEDGTLLLVAGFGIYHLNPGGGDGILRATVVPVADSKFSETEFIVDQRDGHGACGGDSGGPAFVMTKDKLYLAGITSRGSENCELTILTNTRYISQFLRAVSNREKENE